MTDLLRVIVLPLMAIALGLCTIWLTLVLAFAS